MTRVMNPSGISIVKIMQPSPPADIVRARVPTVAVISTASPPRILQTRKAHRPLLYQSQVKDRQFASPAQQRIRCASLRRCRDPASKPRVAEYNPGPRLAPRPLPPANSCVEDP